MDTSDYVLTALRLLFLGAQVLAQLVAGVLFLLWALDKIEIRRKP